MKPKQVVPRLLLPLVLILPLLLGTSAALAAQAQGDWEISLFAARTGLDDKALFEREESILLDYGDDFVTNGVIKGSLDLDDDFMAGIRFGYAWTQQIETEFVYDRNHTGGLFLETIDDLDLEERVSTSGGRVSAVFTSYQLGALFHPLGKRKNKWQPYLTLAAGWMDVDFQTSDSLAAAIGRRLPRQDHGVMVGYGAGLKFFYSDSVALRLEVRGKSYDLFDERRTDSEVSLGISLFTPGAVY